MFPRVLAAADQTIAVFEPPQPNTGFPGGKFLERAKVYKPGSKLVGGRLVAAANQSISEVPAALPLPMADHYYRSLTTRPAPLKQPLPRMCDLQAWYTEAEMQVGTALDLHGRRFRLVAADAFTEQWSAAHDMSGGAPLEVLY